MARWIATLLLGAAFVAAAPSATAFTLRLAQGEGRRSSAGIFRRGGGLVRQLWANCDTPGRTEALPSEALAVPWDGLDSAGERLVVGEERAAADAFELRWIDTSSVTYDWQGVVGNSGPAVGQNVLRSEDWQQDLAIAGNVGVRAWGYDEGQPGVAMFSTNAPSASTSIAHSDYHRTFVPKQSTVACDFRTKIRQIACVYRFMFAATDGEVGYFVNNGGATGAFSSVISL